MSGKVSESKQVDILIENARIIDGTGSPAFVGGLSIIGNKIDAVGDVRHLKGNHKIDAKGSVISPGFIDCHTHDDNVLLHDQQMSCKVTQGVTTVVAGNCGISLAPFVPSSDFEMPIPMSLLGKKNEYNFPSFADYFKAFELSPPAINAAFLCGHNTIRAGVMGGEVNRPATNNEIRRMESIVAESINSGAIGISSGLMYPAGIHAPTSEVAALAAVSGHLGGLYTTHLRDEAEGLLTSVEEAAEIGRLGDVPVVLSHHKVTGSSNWGMTRDSLKRIDQLAEGQSIHFDVYPYAASATALMPDRLSIAEKILIVASDKYPDKAGKYLKDIAISWDVTELEAAEELLPAQAIYFAMDEDDVQRVLKHERAMIGSDGIPGTNTPHPRLWGTFPRVLGHYSRRLDLFSLETAVYKMTGLTAQIFGFSGRGVLQPGAFADITLFDPMSVIDRANFETPTEPSIGINSVIVGGEIILENGIQNNARPGRVIKRGQWQNFS